MKVALIGTPNCGKTSLFNALTGSHRTVGNYSGVTVAPKCGKLRRNREIEIIDLPGICSMVPYTPEENITRDYLEKESPDCVIAVVDVTNFAKSFYPIFQLMGQRIPMILALNLADQIMRCGGKVNPVKLESMTGIPSVAISAKTGLGIQELERMIETGQAKAGKESIIEKERFEGQMTDAEYRKIAASRWETGALLEKCTVIHGGHQTNQTEKLDRFFLHPVFAYPVLLLMLGITFWIAFGFPGKWLSSFIEQGITALQTWVLHQSTAEWAASFLSDAFFGSIGTVLSFLPGIFLLFFCFSFLEDWGYLARVAFLTDRLLMPFGLSGKAVFSLLSGFGCTSPAALATRTLERTEDRAIVLCMLPFFSCSARLPIYLLILSAFFQSRFFVSLMILYLLGVFLAFFQAKIVRKAFFRNSPPPFCMDLPPYRLPNFKNLLSNSFEKSKGFLQKAGTLIFGLGVFLWLLQHLNLDFVWTGELNNSLFVLFGKWITPLFQPIGFDSWQSSVAIFNGIFAKEAIASTFGVLASSMQMPVNQALQCWFTPASAASFLVFCLLCPPCIPSSVTLGGELGRGKAILLFAWQLLLSYGISFFVYRIALLFC